jgi:chromosome segregation ATPase
MKDSIREKLNHIGTQVQRLIRERNSYRDQVSALTSRLAEESTAKADALTAKAEALDLASKALENDAQQEAELIKAKDDAMDARSTAESLNQEKIALLAELEALKAHETEQDAELEKELDNIDSASDPENPATSN